jgi:phosphoglycolate phosphatase
VPFDVGRLMVGFGARRMIELAAERAGRTLSQVELERMFNAFIAHYAAHIAEHSKPFPGVATALDVLIARGCRLAVCTNKLAHLSRLLLEDLALAPRFVAICGPDTFGVSKPDPVILQRTIAAAGGRPDRAVLVGDSPIDAQTAKAAAVPMIAVDFGYTDIPAAALGVQRVIGHFDQLPGAVFDLFAR